MTGEQPSSVDAYIAEFSLEIAERLHKIRHAILAEVPDPLEKMRYGVAAAMLGGRYALHYAGWKKHIGLDPVPVLPEPLESELAPYRSGKDSVVFPHNAEIPYELISRIAAAIVANRTPAT